MRSSKKSCGVSRRGLLAGGTAALSHAVGVERACGRQADTLRLDFTASGLHAPFYVAMQRGWFRESRHRSHHGRRQWIEHHRPIGRRRIVRPRSSLAGPDGGRPLEGRARRFGRRLRAQGRAWLPGPGRKRMEGAQGPDRQEDRLQRHLAGRTVRPLFPAEEWGAGRSSRAHQRRRRLPLCGVFHQASRHALDHHSRRHADCGHQAAVHRRSFFRISGSTFRVSA